MSKTKSLALGLVIGFLGTYACNRINRPDYHLKEKKEITTIHSNVTGNKQRIYEARDEFFIGNSDNNLQGAIDVAYRLGLDISATLLKEKEQKIDTLETRISRRRFFDKIDESKDKINYWYKDLKRRQIR